MKRILRWIFGCRHPRISFPVKLDGPLKPSTRSCLDCGQEFWDDTLDERRRE